MPEKQKNIPKNAVEPSLLARHRDLKVHYVWKAEIEGQILPLLQYKQKVDMMRTSSQNKQVTLVHKCNLFAIIIKTLKQETEKKNLVTLHWF